MRSSSKELVFCANPGSHRVIRARRDVNRPGVTTAMPVTVTHPQAEIKRKKTPILTRLQLKIKNNCKDDLCWYTLNQTMQIY